MNPDLAAIVSEMREWATGDGCFNDDPDGKPLPCVYYAQQPFLALCDRIESALHSQAHEREGCVWTRTDDAYEGETWNSDCGVKYCFIEEGPAENGHKFCHCCGKPLLIAAGPT